MAVCGVVPVAVVYLVPVFLPGAYIPAECGGTTTAVLYGWYCQYV